MHQNREVKDGWGSDLKERQKMTQTEGVKGARGHFLKQSEGEKEGEGHMKRWMHVSKCFQ